MPLIWPQRCVVSRGNEPRSLRRDYVFRLPIHRHMSGLGRHAIEPGADRGKSPEVEVALVREMRIGVKRNIGDGIAIGREVAMVLEMVFHHAERTVTLLHPILERVPL